MTSGQLPPPLRSRYHIIVKWVQCAAGGRYEAHVQDRRNGPHLPERAEVPDPDSQWVTWHFGGGNSSHTFLAFHYGRFELNKPFENIEPLADGRLRAKVRKGRHKKESKYALYVYVRERGLPTRKDVFAPGCVPRTLAAPNPPPKVLSGP